MYMKVLLFCCKGFEMMEFSSFYDVCGWAKSEYGFDMQVDVCGLYLWSTKKSKHF